MIALLDAIRLKIKNLSPQRTQRTQRRTKTKTSNFDLFSVLFASSAVKEKMESDCPLGCRLKNQKLITTEDTEDTEKDKNKNL